jgi:tRNA nucleotidyltransferase/poly(A) polymerase
MPDPTRQRAFALEIVQKLRAAGFEALWAGGCVRDQLLGLIPKDYDVATSATPDEIRNVFGHRRTIPIGVAFGVVTVLGPRAAGQIEVATFRSDSTYSDGRHPDSVTFTDAQHDAQRRDFTINGLFYDPVAGEVVDYVGGQDDLKRRTIRAIGDPRLRLREDKLRMLRAVRFAATFGFQIDRETLAAIKEMAPDISTVSAERIGMEIRRMLTDPSRADALRLLRDTNLLRHVISGIADLSASDFDDVLSVLQELHDPSLPLALAALLIHATRIAGTQYGVPSTEVTQATTDDSSLPAIRGPQASAQVVGRRLKFTNKEIERTDWLLANRAMVSSASQTAWPRLQRVLIHDGAVELLALHEAIAGPADDELAFCRERLTWPLERLNPEPLVTGADLIAHGLAPGPQFAELLERIRDAQLNGEIHRREEALALVDRLR